MTVNDLERAQELLVEGIALHRRILERQRELLQLLLDPQPAEAEQAGGLESVLIGELRRFQASLRALVDGKALIRWVHDLDPSFRENLEPLVRELFGLQQEMARVNARSYRYVLTSLAFTHSRLQQIFGDSSHYDLQGYLRTGGAERLNTDLVF